MSDLSSAEIEAVALMAPALYNGYLAVDLGREIARLHFRDGCLTNLDTLSGENAIRYRAYLSPTLIDRPITNHELVAV